MKIRWKMFLLMWSMVMMIIGGFAITNTVYLEKFYLTNKKDKLIQMGRVITDPNYIVDFRNLEVQNNAEIIIKKCDQVDKYYQRKQLTEHEVDEIKESLKDEEPIFKTISFEDYRGKALILFMPYKPDRYIEIITPLSLIQEGLELSMNYHLQIIILSFIVGSSMAFIFSKAMVTPILEIKEITQKIAKLDFSRKFESDRTDEIGELGEAINKMGETLEKNIDEINKVNRKLIADIEKEKKLDKLRKEFVACVSHELKTPLTNIKGYLIALEDAPEVMRKKFLNTIKTNVERLENIVLDFLNISKIENSNLVNISQVAVEKIKKELLEILSGKINEKGAKVDFLFNLTDGRDYLKVDSEKIFMILKNLIENGIIYNKNSEPEVIIKVDEKGDRYNISVEDNGIGIPIYEQDKIFERFYRIDKARTSNLGGTGLGLSIVKTLIEKCGGGLVIDSIEGKGTIFSFYILK